MPTKQDVQQLIDESKAKILDLREHGTERMSKTGVKWALEVERKRLTGLNLWLKKF